MPASIEDRLAAIEARNAKVETEKAWETSWVRRGSVALITYIVISIMLMIVGHDGAWIHSLVPVIGYLLSTLALPFVRQQWQKHKNLT